MADDVAGRVKKVVAKQLNIGDGSIADESRFVQDLGADSMKSIELIAAFEEEFDLDMDMDEAGKVQTVSGAVDFIKSELEKA